MTKTFDPVKLVKAIVKVAVKVSERTVSREELIKMIAEEYERVS